VGCLSVFNAKDTAYHAFPTTPVGGIDMDDFVGRRSSPPFILGSAAKMAAQQLTLQKLSVNDFLKQMQLTRVC
jgi:hypothetical protein